MRFAAKEFRGALLAAKMHACTDTTRPRLNCVRIEATGGALRFVSTDGHTLFACEIPAETSADDPAPIHQKPWNAPMSAVDALLLDLKGVTDERELLLAKRTVVLADGMGGKTYDEGGEDFPPYRYVVAACEAKGKGSRPHVGSAYLARACEALRVYSAGFAPDPLGRKATKQERAKNAEERARRLDPPVAWRAASDREPIYVYSPTYPKAFVLIMPRVGGGAGAEIDDFLRELRSER